MSAVRNPWTCLPVLLVILLSHGLVSCGDASCDRLYSMYGCGSAVLSMKRHCLDFCLACQSACNEDCLATGGGEECTEDCYDYSVECTDECSVLYEEEYAECEELFG